MSALPIQCGRAFKVMEDALFAAGHGAGAASSGACIVSGSSDKTPAQEEAGQLAREDRLQEVVSTIYDRVSATAASGLFWVMYAAQTTGYKPEVWQKTNDFNEASEMVPTLTMFLLSLPSLKTAKVWFEERFAADGRTHETPKYWGVCTGNARRGDDVPPDAWDALPRTRDELMKEPLRKRAASTLEDEEEAPVAHSSAPAPMTRLEAVAAGGIDPLSVPLGPLVAQAAETMQRSLFFREQAPKPEVDKLADSPSVTH